FFRQDQLARVLAVDLRRALRQRGARHPGAEQQSQSQPPQHADLPVPVSLAACLLKRSHALTPLAGLVPAIHVLFPSRLLMETWAAATSLGEREILRFDVIRFPPSSALRPLAWPPAAA